MRKWLFGGSPQSVWAVDAAADRCYEQAVAPRPPMSEEQLKAFLEKVKLESLLITLRCIDIIAGYNALWEADGAIVGR